MITIKFIANISIILRLAIMVLYILLATASKVS